MSEEAQECRNKDFKNYREHHTRKNSRLNTNNDLLHILLISSDPVISSLRKIKTKNSSKFSNEARTLLKINDLNLSDTNYYESEYDN